MGDKSNRNKTITLSELDIEALSKRLMQLNSPCELDDVLNKTIHQDMLEAIPYLPDQSVDLLFADPPYNLYKQFNTTRFRQMGDDAYEKWIESWFLILLPKLKPTASIYLCGDWRSSSALFRVLNRHTIVQNRITWEREKGRGSKNNWKNASEDIWFATVSKDFYFDVESVKIKKKVNAPYRDTSGKPKDWQDDDKGNNYRLTHPSNMWTDLTVPFWSMPENTEHPTQKPEKLVAKIILASSQVGDVILDPFLGSGTTSVVAKKLNRHYIGIEKDHYFACVAEKRLDLAEQDTNIQGYTDNTFWDRNTIIKPTKK